MLRCKAAILDKILPLSMTENLLWRQYAYHLLTPTPFETRLEYDMDEICFSLALCFQAGYGSITRDPNFKIISL